MRLKARIEKLEGATRPDLDPEVKAWLGMTLTPAEQAIVASRPKRTFDPSTIDATGWPEEMKEWLGLA